MELLVGRLYEQQSLRSKSASFEGALFPQGSISWRTDCFSNNTLHFISFSSGSATVLFMHNLIPLSVFPFPCDSRDYIRKTVTSDITQLEFTASGRLKALCYDAYLFGDRENLHFGLILFVRVLDEY